MAPFLDVHADCKEIEELLFDEKEVDNDDVLIDSIAGDLSDEELIQAFVDEHLEFDVPPIPDDDDDDDELGDDDSAELEKFDRAAVIGSKLSGRKKLFSYFRWRVVETKTWDKNRIMPGKGKDLDFDNFLLQIDMQKRKNAATAWLLYRKSLGVVIASTIFSDKEKILDEYHKQTGNREDLVDAAISKTRSFTGWKGYSEEQYVRLEACSRSSQFFEAACDMVRELNEQLADALCGVNATNVDERVNKFTRHKSKILQTSLRDSFVATWDSFIGRHGVELATNELRLWGVKVFSHLVDEWTEAIWQHDFPDIVVELEDYQIEDLLKGSQPTLYVIAGWMSFRIGKRLTKRSHFDTVQEFVRNTVASESDFVRLNSVMDKLDRKEIHKGKLRRSSYCWFEFIKALDALYCVNLTSANALKYGADILKQIGEAIASSAWLEDKFVACIPSSISKNGKDYLLRIYRSSILPSYSRMRGKDVVRRIKSRKSSFSKLTDGMATRTKVKAASFAAASKS
jgi:hypothetical protein